MRKIAATYIFPVNQPPVKNSILVCDDDGTIVEIISKGDDFREEAGVEFYSGVLVPGFVHVNFSLQNYGKISNRKMWANGIVLVADFQSSTYVITQKNDCKIQKLNTDFIDLNQFPKLETSVGTYSFLQEIFLYQEKNKRVKLSDLFASVSLNRAKMLRLDAKFGSFEKGKNPGINLISGIDFKQLTLTSTSKVKRLV